MNSRVEFRSSIEKLNRGFVWAKNQALEYVHDGEDQVGLWYEAALPAREAFCMRDVSHQSYGASVLGLSAHTKNMLMKFAENISESKDYCTYWEITRENLPCRDDYENNRDFWYNLPGSFEMIRACYQQCLWNMDSDYYTDKVFRRFYELTCTRYVELWDRDRDGILEHYKEYGRRGLASYNESDVEILTAGDMLASQYAAYDAYAAMLEMGADTEKADMYRRKRDILKKVYLEKWYDQEKKEFYGAIKSDGTFYEGYYKEGNFLPLFFGILDGEETLGDAVKQLKENGVDNVEGMSYLPAIYYNCGEEETACESLLRLCEEGLERREYPEVSYAVVGTIANQLMGIRVKEKGHLQTLSKLQKDAWADISNVPVFRGEVSLRHEGRKCSVLENCTGSTLIWEVGFMEEYDFLICDGKKVNVRIEKDNKGRAVTWASIPVESGGKAVVEVQKN